MGFPAASADREYHTCRGNRKTSALSPLLMIFWSGDDENKSLRFGRSVGDVTHSNEIILGLPKLKELL